MYATPLNFLGPIGGKRILMWGVGAEAVGLALAGAEQLVRRAFGSAVVGECWIGVEKRGE